MLYTYMYFNKDMMQPCSGINTGMP